MQKVIRVLMWILFVFALFILLAYLLVCDVGYNPFARWAGLLKNKVVGPGLQESLDYLTTVCEVLAEENALIVELTNVELFWRLPATGNCTYYHPKLD